MLTPVSAASLGAPSPPQQRLGRPAFGHGRVDQRFDAVYQLENSARSVGSVSVRVAASKLSYRDVCDLMAERGVSVVHTTVLRWVQFFVPAFEKMWMKYARPVGSSWRVDETYINHGACAALKNAIDFLYHEWTNKAAGFVAIQTG